MSMDDRLKHVADTLSDNSVASPTRQFAALEGASAARAAALMAPLEAKARELRAKQDADIREGALKLGAKYLRTTVFNAVYDDMGQKAAEGVQRAAAELLGMVGLTPPEADPALANLARIPVARSVVYAVRGAPDVPDEYNETRTIAPTEISLTYRAAPDSQLGRVHAYVKGWWMQDGARVHAEAVGRHFTGDPTAWPEWLAAEARLHDPDPS
ncbi:hypothetical protein ACFWWC_03670 [Streptomyces sp. NPDC058642]|uniref:hypothetical protein n=1 Tax=Streptomyces sp. NPDC058642 TaxID=3346572 RepID=UPI003659319F